MVSNYNTTTTTTTTNNNDDNNDDDEIQENINDRSKRNGNDYVLTWRLGMRTYFVLLIFTTMKYFRILSDVNLLFLFLLLFIVFSMCPPNSLSPWVRNVNDNSTKSI